MNTKTVKINVDNDPMNPRTESDNLALMVCAHRRYSLGDTNAKEIMAKKLKVSVSEYSESELVAKCHKAKLIFMSKPLYLYDHSGITMSTGPFSCQFDSGQVGEIIVFKDDARSEFGVKRLSKKNKAMIEAKVEKNIDDEVRIYDGFISGEVYSVQILDEEGEVEDEEHGFYGSNFETNGILNFVPEELHELAKNANICYS